MHGNIRKKCLASTIFLFSVLPCQVISAQFHLSMEQFRFHANENGFSQFDSLRWNPSGKRPYGAVYGNFHGEGAQSCEILVNCDISTTPACFTSQLQVQSIEQTTGLLDTGAIALSPQCPTDLLKNGRSYMASKVGSSPHAGLAIYTYTGGTDAFFQPFAQGSSYSTNAGLQGNYIIFDTGAEQAQMKPFSAPCSGTQCAKRIKMRVWSKQAVKSSRVADPEKDRTLQAISLAFANTKEADASAEIIFAPKVFCQGQSCDRDTLVWQDDPNQGGIPFIGGYLGSAGETSQLVGSERIANVWTSRGPATKHSPFPLTWFAYEISWRNFIDTLRFITDERGGDGDNDAEVAEIFGPGWKYRFNWVLKNARFGQEAKNLDWGSSKEVFVGGYLKWYQVDAITTSAP